MFTPSLRIYGLSGHRALFTKTIYTLTGFRNLGIVYQNTTGRPLIVTGGEESGAGSLTVYCDSSPSPTTIVNEGYGFGNQWFPFFFLVPPNYYYEVTNVGGTSMAWVEFTINDDPVIFSGELSGSRSIGTTYQNTSGKAKIAVVDIADSNPNELVSCVCDSSPAPTTTVSDYMVEAGGGNPPRNIAVLMIPNGYYYKITGASASVLHWNEYTMPFNATQSSDLAGASRLYDTLYTNGVNNMFIVASGRTSQTGQVSAANAAGFSNTLISTWPNDDAALWAIAQPGDSYNQTAGGSSSTLAHWFEYQLT